MIVTTMEAEGALPEWVELLPAGPRLVGTDGREWVNDAPEAILSAFQVEPSLVIDWEHASELRATQGLSAPAAGWVDQLESRDGAIWGHVQRWTETAARQILAGEYRHLSPVFLYEKNTGRIRKLVSAGLTNHPNLPLVALNRADGTQVATGATFETSAALRAEFGTLERYRAYQAAHHAGQARVYPPEGSR